MGMVEYLTIITISTIGHIFVNVFSIFDIYPYIIIARKILIYSFPQVNILGIIIAIIENKTNVGKKLFFIMY